MAQVMAQVKDENIKFTIPKKMLGMKLPGNEIVQAGMFEVPKPGVGQVLLKIKSAGICGSDLKYIYYTHNGTGGARYDDVIAGHEPCGQIVATGDKTGDFKIGDRVVVYHIQGCGLCEECRKGYMIGCTSPERRAYGWQRDGAFAEYMLADVSTLIHLPDSLTYDDGAMVACGFGTAYQGLMRAHVSGKDNVLVMGLGPVGQAAVMLAKALGARVIAADIIPERIEMAKKVGADECFISDDQLIGKIKEVTNGKGVEVAIDCSGNAIGRHLCLEAARLWGNVVYIGEQGTVTFEPSPMLLHKQLTLHGSWVTSLDNMRDVLDLLDAKKLHPDQIITDRFELEDTQEAFRKFASGKTGKVVISMLNEADKLSEGKLANDFADQEKIIDEVAR